MAAEVGLYESNLPQTYGNCLFIVDPQLDFHPDDKKRNFEGSLGVPGANEDSKRIAKLIADNIDKLDEIYVTMDTHMSYHIAHQSYWKDKQGNPPKPYTCITKQDVKNGTWTPVKKTVATWALQYVTKLEAQGRFQLTIWPDHCRVGTRGHCINEEIMEALDEWEARRTKTVHYVVKGNNSNTEHYSALRAEVPIKGENETMLNTKLIGQLKQHKRIFICGEALSHCVNYTTRDLVQHFDKRLLGRLCVLRDASSSVKGFEADGEKFLKDMEAAGLVIADAKSANSLFAK